MTLSRTERAAFIEHAAALRGVSKPDVMTGDEAVNYMIQAAGGA